MASKECFHFTKVSRLNSINKKGLEARLEDNSKSVGDQNAKVSYSDSKIGAIGLFSNFYTVYQDYKTGKRQPRPEKPGEMEMYEKIMKSKSFEDYLGDGVYLLFDGTGIENDGGNHGDGGIYDASTKNSIEADKLKVGLVRNDDTKSVSYSMFDYMHYLMSTLTEEEYNQMIEPMQERFDIYYKDNSEKIDRFKDGNYSKKELKLDKFCEVCKDIVDKAEKMEKREITNEEKEDR